MKIWVKLTKHFQGGSKEDYFYIDKSVIDTDEKEQEFMENWGEQTDGGHSYGYRVYIDWTIKKPPEKWLKERIEKFKKEITSIREEKRLTKKERIKIKKDDITFYKRLL
jgi:hypothetical protein